MGLAIVAFRRFRHGFEEAFDDILDGHAFGVGVEDGEDAPSGQAQCKPPQIALQLSERRQFS